MKYASEKSLNTSVHSWKPVVPEKFAERLHALSCSRSDEHGNEGMPLTTSVKLDRVSTATVYYTSKSGKGREGGIYMPALMTMQRSDGKVICFEWIDLDEEIAWADDKTKTGVRPDGVTVVDSGLHFRTQPKSDAPSFRVVWATSEFGHQVASFERDVWETDALVAELDRHFERKPGTRWEFLDVHLGQKSWLPIKRSMMFKIHDGIQVRQGRPVEIEIVDAPRPE